MSTRIEARALIALGRIDDMEELFDARANPRNPGNLGSAYHLAGLELGAHGHAELEWEMSDRAIESCRALPAENFPAQRENLCNALMSARRWDEAHVEIDTPLAASPENLDYVATLGVVAVGR